MTAKTIPAIAALERLEITQNNEQTRTSIAMASILRLRLQTANKQKTKIDQYPSWLGLLNVPMDRTETPKPSRMKKDCNINAVAHKVRKVSLNVTPLTKKMTQVII